MSVNFEQISDFSDYGNKAKNLVMLKNAGFNVPDGFVLGASFSDEILKNSDIQKTLAALYFLTNKSQPEVSEITGLMQINTTDFTN